MSHEFNYRIDSFTDRGEYDNGTWSSNKKGKKSNNTDLEADSGIVLIDDDLVTDKEKELEERRAYLEEARSQDSMD